MYCYSVSRVLPMQPIAEPGNLTSHCVSSKGSRFDVRRAAHFTCDNKHESCPADIPEEHKRKHSGDKNSRSWRERNFRPCGYGVTTDFRAAHGFHQKPALTQNAQRYPQLAPKLRGQKRRLIPDPQTDRAWLQPTAETRDTHTGK